MSDIAKAAEKLPARKVKVKTVYGIYEVEHKGELRKRDVDNYREMLETEGQKQGWARLDGKTTDANKAVENIRNVTPAQYEQAKQAVAKPAPKAKAPAQQPRVNSSAQSKITAYDQSRVDQDPTQEYTGGDAKLARNGQGKGKTSTELRRMAPQDEGVNVNDKTKQILQGIETVVGTVLDKTGLYRKANDLVEGVAKSNDQAATYDPLLGMLAGVATDTLHPVSSFASATGNLYDPTATAEERLGAAGNVALYGLGAAGNLTAAKSAASALEKLAAQTIKGFENKRIAKTAATSGVNDLIPTGTAPKQEASPLEKLMAESKVVPETPPPPPAVAPTLEASPSAGLFSAKNKLTGTPDAPADKTIWHHGTTKQFDNVDFGKLHNDLGFFLTSDESLAKQYTKLSPFAEEDSVGAVKSYSVTPKKVYDIRFGADNAQSVNEVLDAMISRADRAVDTAPNGTKALRAYEKFKTAKQSLLNAKTIDEWKSAEAKMYDATQTLADAENPGGKAKNAPLREELLNLGYDAVRKGDDGADALVVLDQNILKPQSTPPTKPTTEAPGVTTSAPMADLQPNTTGISNAANLDDVEAGLLTEVAKGEGKSAKAVYEANRNREDYIEVAKRVRDGAPLSAENTATLLAGGQKLTKRVYDTREAVRQAIANGADQATIAKLNNEYAKARTIKDEFAQDVQKGKSGWSDVGRVLAKKVDIDTGNIEQVAEEARIRKGADLTDKELETLQNQVNELKTTVSEKDAKIASLMDDLVKATEATSTIRRTGFSKEQTGSVRIQAKNRFQEAKRKAGSVASLNALQGVSDPEVIKAFGEYVRAVVDDGARGITEVIQKMADDGVAVDSEDIYKGMTARTGLRKLSDIQKEIIDAKRELVKDAVQGPKKAKDVVQGPNPPKEIGRVLKSRENVRARIAELEDQIKTGQYIEAQPKVKREIDAEVYRLRQIEKMKQKQVKDAIERMRPKSAAEKFGSYSSEVKLLNPASRVKDLISNTLNLVSTGIETPARFLVDASTAKFTKSDMILGVEGNAETLGIIKDRVKATAKTDLQEAWQGLDSGAADKFGYAKGLGGKAAAMTDAPFKTIYRETANVRLAEEKAKRVLGKDATMAKVKDMRDEILSNLDEHPDIQMGAEEYALYKTFNNDNAISKFNARVKSGTNDLGAATYDELIGRFSKVITNVGLDKLDRTGFGIVRGLTKVVTSKGALTAAERMIINDMMAKGMTGLPIVTLGYFLSDKVKGEIKDGYRKYIDHGDLGDMGGVMAAFLYGADMKQAEKLGSKAGSFRFTTTAKLATDSPFSSNVQDVFDLADDPTLSGLTDYVAKKGTNIVIPGGVRDVARRMDSKQFPVMTGKEKEREKYPKGTKAAVDKLNHKSAEAIWKMILGETKSKLPVLRQQLPKK